MFNENSEDDNTYIQYNEKDKKISKKYKNNTEYLKHIDNKQIISIRFPLTVTAGILFFKKHGFF